MISLVDLMQGIVVEELQNDTLNDALFSKGVSLLAKQMDRFLDRLEAMDINNIATRIARGFVERMNINSGVSMNKNIQSVSGIDLPRIVRNEGIEQLIEIKAAENAALIKSIKDEYKEKVSKLVRDNVMNGERPSNIVTQIKEIGGMSKGRAKTVARTESAKLNADIVQIRAEAIGSKTYIWSASMDERTRASHKVLDGMLCKFDDNTVYSDDDGKTWKKRSSIGAEEQMAGKSYNCRCVILPVVKW